MSDPFRALGVETSFDLDPAVLAARHKELSLEAHPDRLRSDRVARRAALSRAIDVNAAFRTLRDPVARAEALLVLRGESDVASERPDPEFLMTILERREALSEALARREAGRIEEMLSAVARDRAASEGEISRIFSLEGWGEGDRRALGHHLSALRYYRRFEEEAAAYLDEI